MIKTHVSQLNNQLKIAKKQGKLFQCFLLIGNEPYLRYEAQRNIHDIIQDNAILQRHEFVINDTTDWHSLFQSYQSLNLFLDKTLITLYCDDTVLSAPIMQKLKKLTTPSADNVSLVILINKMTKLTENSEWLKAIRGKTIWIDCQSMDTSHLLIWLTEQTKKLKINLDQAAISLLCRYYEGNLLALSQLLEQLKLLYQNGNISFNDVERNINDCAIFSPYHWIDALFLGQTERTIHIIQQLKNTDFQPLILLRILQKELILLISMKKELLAGETLKNILYQHKVWKNRLNLFSEVLNRVELKQLYAALYQLTNVELSFKSGDGISIWQQLENLSLLLIDKRMNRALHA